MPSILAIIRNQFKYIYLKNQKVFLNILLHFQKIDKILNILKKKLDPRSLSISEIIHS